MRPTLTTSQNVYNPGESLSSISWSSSRGARACTTAQDGRSCGTTSTQLGMLNTETRIQKATMRVKSFCVCKKITARDFRRVSTCNWWVRPRPRGRCPRALCGWGYRVLRGWGVPHVRVRGKSGPALCVSKNGARIQVLHGQRRGRRREEPGGVVPYHQKGREDEETERRHIL